MVRGRRHRKVPQCEAVNDAELCSPNAKRKDQVGATTTITNYFKVKTKVKEIKEELPRNISLNGFGILLEDNGDLDDVKKEQFTEISELIVNEMRNPSTPHRIELCDAADDKILLQEAGVTSTTNDDYCNGAGDDDEAKIVCDEKKEAVLMKVFATTPKKPNSKSTTTNRNIKGRKKLLATADVKKEITPQGGKQQGGGGGGEMTMNNNQVKLTDFFPAVRRSERKTKKTVMAEKQRHLENVLRKGLESGLEVHCFDEKGRGVVAKRLFERGDFVVEYSGDLIDLSEAKIRETKYAQDKNKGCYMYYFKHKGVQHCVDATEESGKLGRLVNHSRNGNLVTRTIDVDGKPRLVLVAKDSIKVGEELTYDYGDRSKESLKHHPWLAY